MAVAGNKTLVALAACWFIGTPAAPLARAGGLGAPWPERRALAAASPLAPELVDQAEAALVAGRARQAWELLAQAAALAPRSPIPRRGMCRIVLALGITTAGQRAAALQACDAAATLGGTAEDIRNKVAARVRGEPAPSMDDLVAASFAAEGAARLGVGQPWGAAARVDLALRLGSPDLLDDALAELVRTAPEHEETKRMIALVDGRRSLAARAAWPLGAALALLGLAAAWRWRTVRRRRRGRRDGGLRGLAAAPAAALALVLVTTTAAPAAAAPVAAAALPDPGALAGLLTELSEKAAEATRRGDHVAAARYWTALAEAVPDSSFAFGRLCDALEASGDGAGALVACRTALTRRGTTAGDYTHFVKLLVAKEGPLSASDRRQIDVALGQLDKEPNAALIAESVRCDVAVHDHDVGALEACTAKLAAAAPGDARTVSFQWALAHERGDRAAAERALSAAPAAGVAPPLLARMRALTDGLPGPSRARLARAARWATAGAAGFLAALLVYAIGRRALGAARRQARGRAGETG